jgi:hypothetical protein
MRNNIRGELSFKRVQKSTCKLSLFTWACVESSSGKEVAPMCPSHVHSYIRSGRLGTDIVLVCEAGKHLLGLCERETFESEREEAKAKLIGDTNL